MFSRQIENREKYEPDSTNGYGILVFIPNLFTFFHKLQSVTASAKCPSCSEQMTEVNYDENNSKIDHVSFVMADGSKVRGQVRKYLCPKCFLLHEFIDAY